MALQNHNSSNIKVHWSQITTKHIITIKIFEVLQELPKCDREIQSEKMLEDGAHRLSQCRVAPKLQFLKNAVSAKHSKVKIN